ncbi:LysR family transcriptional regulator, glycine cleavage system transcriptional activator [Achromobacter sp. NFACC18-2]|nr:transcriptional regulator GcvA [Achromobacter sp. NFACC18-2]SEK05356.1 LysR family transcriptional regulator, glycine cleavage system transcriptional activator [Achromobacter sp. NFACC18-2]
MSDLHQLPNLLALRAFEAAARHQNFSRAADEIHVTHGAVSHQVRALEQDLGVALFTRYGKRLTITQQGAQFAQAVRSALQDIAQATQAIREDTRQKRLTVSSIPSFAARWLAPRLGKFIEQNPSTELVLQTSGRLQDLVRDGIDVGIRFGQGQYPGLAVERLMGDSYYPVASPGYNQGRLPSTPRQLKPAQLLRSDEPWLPWFQAANLTLAEPTGGVRFQDLSMLIRSAVAGNGIALVRHVVAMQEIATGELVRLFDVAVKSPWHYYLACSPEALHKPQVQAFRQWLMEEITIFKTQTGQAVD